jgi:hypothetical protein
MVGQHVCPEALRALEVGPVESEPDIGGQASRGLVGSSCAKPDYGHAARRRRARPEARRAANVARVLIPDPDSWPSAA